RHHTRRIEKPGPTGLITTSTRSLRTQLGTRHLEVPLSDDPQQVREVMKAHARSVSGVNTKRFDTTPFLASQRWLALAGVRRVVVPFADVLSDLLPATAVRMNRDFRQLLTCVQSVALLRQRQRERTADGAVIATIEDYAEARKLLATVFDTIASEGVTPAVRETVEAVQPDEEVSAADLARRLSRSKATISYRVGRALKDGWLVNREPRKGHAARLARGAPLPEMVTALPKPDRVREAFECSSRSGGAKDPAPSPRAAEDAGGTPGGVHHAEPGSVKPHPASGNGVRPVVCGPAHEHVCPGCGAMLKCTVPPPCDFTQCVCCKLEHMQRGEGEW